MAWTATTSKLPQWHLIAMSLAKLIRDECTILCQGGEDECRAATNRLTLARQRSAVPR